MLQCGQKSQVYLGLCKRRIYMNIWKTTFACADIHVDQTYRVRLEFFMGTMYIYMYM